MPQVDSQDFALIESLLYDAGYQRLQRHLARLRAAAAELGFRLDESAVLRLLEQQAEQLTAGGSRQYKVRLLLEADGLAWVSAEEITAPVAGLQVMIADQLVSSAASHSRFKTTRRQLFDSYSPALRSKGLYDVLFLNERSELAEASRSNVFVELAGELLTPPLAAGILPGVYRAQVLEQESRAREAPLSVKDLEHADALFLCNSVRGWQRVSLRPGRLSVEHH